MNGGEYRTTHSESSGPQKLTEVTSQQTALHPNADSNTEMMSPRTVSISFIIMIPCKLKSCGEKRLKAWARELPPWTLRVLLCNPWT